MGRISRLDHLPRHNRIAAAAAALHHHRCLQVVLSFLHLLHRFAIIIAFHILNSR
jgi:hypothetical protein